MYLSVIGPATSNELFCAAQQVGTKFVLRTCVDRLAEEGGKKVSAVMKQVPVKAVHRVEVLDRNHNVSEAVLDIKYRRVCVYAPLAKRKHYGPLTLTVIQARERNKPKGRDRVDWKLVTNLPVRCRKDAIEKLDWYALRWNIEIIRMQSTKAAALTVRRDRQDIANLHLRVCDNDLVDEKFDQLPLLLEGRLRQSLARTSAEVFQGGC